MSTLAASMTREQRTVLDAAMVRKIAAELGTVRTDNRFEVLLRGLLRFGIVRSSETGYAFVHDLLREYFAGLWLVENQSAPEQLAEHAVDPAWQRAVVHSLALLSARDLEAAFEQIWKVAEPLPPPQRWAVRRIALEGALQTTNSQLRAQIVDRAFEAVDQAQRDGEPEELCAAVTELLDDP
jgi:hypothetical protein